MRAAQRLEQRFDAALGIVSSVDGRALGDAATRRVDQSGKPPHPGPRATTTTTTTTTTNGAALAAAAFARLVQHGVERNPGPPRYDARLPMLFLVRGPGPWTPEAAAAAERRWIVWLAEAARRGDTITGARPSTEHEHRHPFGNGHAPAVQRAQADGAFLNACRSTSQSAEVIAVAAAKASSSAAIAAGWAASHERDAVASVLAADVVVDNRSLVEAANAVVAQPREGHDVFFSLHDAVVTAARARSAAAAAAAAATAAPVVAAITGADNRYAPPTPLDLLQQRMALICHGRALAAAAFARLVQHGVERNPGPPKRAARNSAADSTPSEQSPVSDERRKRLDAARAACAGPLRIRTPEERLAHAKVLTFFAENATSMKPGDVFHVRVRDETVMPPRTYVVSFKLVERLETCAGKVRPDRGALGRTKAMLVPQWFGEGTTTGSASAPAYNMVMPMRPHPCADTCEEYEEVTYLDISTRPYASSKNGGLIEWSELTDAPTRDYDAERVQVLRRADGGGNRVQFAKRVAAIVAGYSAARGDTPADELLRADIWHALLSLPKRSMVQLSGMGISSHLRNAFATAQLFAGKVLRQVCVMALGIRATGADEQPDRDDIDARTVRSARALGKQGFVGKSSQRLAAEPLPEQDAKVMGDNLERLHPAGSDPVLSLPAAAGAAADGAAAVFKASKDGPLRAPTCADFKALVKGAMNGCATGGSAWTEEMLFDVCEADPATGAILAQMITDLGNAWVPESVQRRIVAGDLVGIPKPDGGTRPIAMSECFLKLATRMALAHDAKAVKAVFGNIQLGVNVPNGAETIVHATRAFIRGDDGAAADLVDKRVVMALDFSNAFNCPDRQLMWERVRDLPALRGIYALEYARASDLRLRCDPGRVVKSRRGTRQGTTGGPVFFCLAMHPVLLEAARVPGVNRVFAFMDDVTILAENRAAAARAAAIIQQGAAAISMSLNPKKCEILSRSTPTKTNTIVDEFANVSVLKLLGASIGFTDAAEKKHLLDRVGGKFADWFRRVKLMACPVGAAVLAVAGIPKLGFLLRTHSPHVTVDVAKQFDSSVEDIWSTWAMCDVDERTRAMAHLPPSLGGLGLTRNEQMAQFAYRASLASVGMVGPDGAREKSQAALARPHFEEMAEYVDSDPLLKRTRELNAQPGALTLLRDVTARATTRSLGGFMRTVLGAHLAGCPSSIPCPGCGKSLSAQDFGSHAATCARVPGTNASSAHQAHKNVVHRLCALAKVSIQSREPRDCHTTVCPGCKVDMRWTAWAAHKTTCRLYDERVHSEPKSRGPDIRIGLDPEELTAPTARSTLVDVTGVSALAESNRNKPLAQLHRDRDREKHALYDPMAAELDEVLVVASASAEHGIMSRPERTLVARLGRHAGMTEPEACRMVQREIQAAHGAARANAEDKAGLMLLARAALAAKGRAPAASSNAPRAPQDTNVRVVADGAPRQAPWLMSGEDRAAAASKPSADAAAAAGPAAPAVPAAATTAAAAATSAAAASVDSSPASAMLQLPAPAPSSSSSSLRATVAVVVGAAAAGADAAPTATHTVNAPAAAAAADASPAPSSSAVVVNQHLVSTPPPSSLAVPERDDVFVTKGQALEFGQSPVHASSSDESLFVIGWSAAHVLRACAEVVVNGKSHESPLVRQAYGMIEYLRRMLLPGTYVCQALIQEAACDLTQRPAPSVRVPQQMVEAVRAALRATELAGADGCIRASSPAVPELAPQPQATAERCFEFGGEPILALSDDPSQLMRIGATSAGIVTRAWKIVCGTSKSEGVLLLHRMSRALLGDGPYGQFLSCQHIAIAFARAQQLVGPVVPAPDAVVRNLRVTLRALHIVDASGTLAPLEVCMPFLQYARTRSSFFAAAATTTAQHRHHHHHHHHLTSTSTATPVRQNTNPAEATSLLTPSQMGSAVAVFEN